VAFAGESRQSSKVMNDTPCERRILALDYPVPNLIHRCLH